MVVQFSASSSLSIDTSPSFQYTVHDGYLYTWAYRTMLGGLSIDRSTQHRTVLLCAQGVVPKVLEALEAFLAGVVYTLQPWEALMESCGCTARVAEAMNAKAAGQLKVIVDAATAGALCWPLEIGKIAGLGRLV